MTTTPPAPPVALPHDTIGPVVERAASLFAARLAAGSPPDAARSEAITAALGDLSDEQRGLYEQVFAGFVIGFDFYNLNEVSL